MSEITVDIDEDQEEFTVIIDIGQGSTKVGYAGDEKPRSVFPTVTGKPKYKQMMAGVNVQEIYVGDDTTKMRGVLKLSYPINRGNVMDWEQYFAILGHIFYNVLRVEPAKCNVIYIVPPLTPSDSAQYFARVLFETHKCKTVGIIDSATTSLFSVGETTALSVELGTGLTHITPVMNGQLYNPSIQRLNLAGMDIEEYLNSLLTQYGQFQKKEIVRDIKEKACKIAMDPNTDSQDSSKDNLYTLPDGSTFNVNAYISTFSGEVLFNPTLLGAQTQSIQQSIINAIRSIDPYYYRIMLGKIILSGGTAYFAGLKERIEKEVELLVPQLGTLPPPQQEVEEVKKPEVVPDKPKTMVQISTKKEDKIDNCPKCGELVDSGSKFCPACGNKFEQQQISIMGAATQEFPKECPKCSNKLDGTSAFCSNCGSKLEPIISEEKKLARKEKKLIKKTAADNKELESLAASIADEYGDEEELAELEKEEDKKEEEKKKKLEEKSSKLINVIVSEGMNYASFKGAAILGELPSFMKFMIDHATFNQNPSSVVIDFSKVINPQ
jgi:actin, other eukaryote